MTFSRRPSASPALTGSPSPYLVAKDVSTVLRWATRSAWIGSPPALARDVVDVKFESQAAATPASVMIAGTKSDGAALTAERCFFSSALTTTTGSEERSHG